MSINKKHIEIFELYAQYHKVMLRPMPSARHKHVFCSTVCDKCVATDICDMTPIMNKDTTQHIIDNYPEYLI